MQAWCGSIAPAFEPTARKLPPMFKANTKSRTPMTNPAMLHATLLFIAATALLLATMYDVAVRIVPNGLSLIVAVAGLGMNTIDGQLLAALFGGGLVFAAMWQCWRRGWIGGGDVKLLSACALLVPPASVPELVLTTGIAGGILALFYLALGRLLPRRATSRPAGRPGARPGARPTGLLARVWRAERRRIRRSLSLPYACAISAGVLLTLSSPVPFG
jgi:prepilin peptidase CpaA